MIASLKFIAKNEKDKKKLAIKVAAKVSGKKFGVGVGGQFKQLAESVKDISTLTISYKATAPLVTVPVDIDTLVKAIEDFPTSVSGLMYGKNFHPWEFFTLHGPRDRGALGTPPPPYF